MRYKFVVRVYAAGLYLAARAPRRPSKCSPPPARSACTS
ncbi:MAG: hypothetical protein IPG91_09080 [Ideonella sp.]|nr:hypothetical protein [Ideonella sp.]